MADKYEKLEKIRADIRKTKNRIEKLQAELKNKEGKLKDAEAEQMLSDINELSLTPEQLGEFLERIKSERIVPDNSVRIPTVMGVINDEEETEDTEDDV